MEEEIALCITEEFFSKVVHMGVMKVKEGMETHFQLLVMTQKFIKV
jgi:hypothetical protein